MSYKRWLTKGEPLEPSFQEPELFINAMKALGSTVKKTVPELCRELHFSEEVFTEITGIIVPQPASTRAKVLTFAN